MIYFIILLIITNILLLFLFLSCTREVRYLVRQLEHIEDGSHMKLTSRIRNKSFLLLYRRLNRIFAAHQTKEMEYLHSQKQLKQTISSIAHDIRTPLTGAAGYLQILSESTQDPKLERYEEIIGKRLEELKEMLEELFLYTKLTSPDFELECTNIAVFPVLSDSMISMYHLFEEKGLSPIVDFQEEELYLTANQEALGRIFRNLINNALLHGGGSLVVSQRGNVIEFCNPLSEQNGETGQAIDPSQLFERFYKADQARRKGSSGLGLAIVKELMMRMGGSVEARLENRQLVIALKFLPASQRQSV